MAYVVTAGRVSAETQVSEKGGRATVDFYRGEVLPDDVPAETVQAFLKGGMVVDEAAVDAAPNPDPEPEPEPVDLSTLDKDALLALAEERGLQVDKRWGEDKLRAALEEN